MKYLGLIIFSLFSAVLSMAQDNDTAVLSANKVSEVKKFQFVHAFADNKDTCLLDYKKYDTLTRVTYHKVDMRCMGYRNHEETILVYNDLGIDTIYSRRDDEDFSVSNYSYDESGKEPKGIHTFFYQTNDSMTITNRYYKNDTGRLDSSFTVSVLQDGSKVFSRSEARYNEQGKMIQLISADGDGVPTQVSTYEISKSGFLLSTAFTTYGEKPYFVQTYYEYNQKGQIANSINTVNQKQEFFYDDNGLIINILAYNPKGKLEIEYLFKYQYHE
ncbi:MAG: hypothetical protein COA58_12125 [Bacteroidetes bacterium]|nr:MAG: hypothetical protein COA58_12125 [Bacteroidota bacterium]